MLGRRAFVPLALVLALALPAGPALAWSNGRNGPDTFGTHDWVLREALTAAGPAAGWVCVRKALRATDDPDTRDGIDHASATWWHVYDVWGASTYGNAPEAIRVWFARTRRLLREDRPCAASRALGIMAHLIGDVAQPMHTDQIKLEERVHWSYEKAVDARCGRASCRYRFGYDGVDPIDPEARAIAVARKAHRDYRSLVETFADRGYNATVDRITRRQLNRAAQALSDLITALD